MTIHARFLWWFVSILAFNQSWGLSGWGSSDLQHKNSVNIHWQFPLESWTPGCILYRGGGELSFGGVLLKEEFAFTLLDWSMVDLLSLPKKDLGFFYWLQLESFGNKCSYTNPFVDKLKSSKIMAINIPVHTGKTQLRIFPPQISIAGPCLVTRCKLAFEMTGL